MAGVTTDSFTGVLQANGGYHGANQSNGRAGTIYFNTSKRTGTWTISTGQTYRLGSDGTNDYSFNNIVVQTGGVLEIDGNQNVNDTLGGAATLNLASLNVQAGGVIRADSLGLYQSSGSGGTYGGVGGNRSKVATYGSITSPKYLGGGGYYDSGGGAILFNVSGTVTIDGLITAIGQACTTTSAGAGGSIAIAASSVTGAGSVRANGGASTSGASGGGGRIAVELSSGTAFGSVSFQAFGGATPGSKGAAGTVYLEKPTDGAGKGQLIIDNNNQTTAGGTDTRISSAMMSNGSGGTVGTIVLRNKGQLTIGTGVTLNVSGTGATNPLITTNASTLLTNSGTLKLGQGTYSIASNTLSLTDRRNTVQFIGNGNGSADTWTITNFATTYATLTLNATDGATDTFLLGAALTATNLNLTVGTLDASATNYGITVNGNWTDTAASAFTKRAGTVTFGSGGTITAYHSFQNVTLNATGKTVTLGRVLSASGALHAHGGDAGRLHEQPRRCASGQLDQQRGDIHREERHRDALRNGPDDRRHGGYDLLPPHEIRFFRGHADLHRREDDYGQQRRNTPGHSRESPLTAFLLQRESLEFQPCRALPPYPVRGCGGFK